MTCFDIWLRSRETIGSSDNEQAVRQVRGFLEAHGTSRFPVIKHKDGTDENSAIGDPAVIMNRAGYRRHTPSGQVQFLVFQEAFKNQICIGYDYRAVANALKERGFLVYEEGHFTINTIIPEVGKARVFCISGLILQ